MQGPCRVTRVLPRGRVAVSSGQGLAPESRALLVRDGSAPWFPHL